MINHLLLIGKKFDHNKFILKTSYVDWDNLLCLDDNNPSKSFDIFYNFIDSTLKDCVPFKKPSNKFKKKFNHKKWMTNGILTSIRKRDELHKKF